MLSHFINNWDYINNNIMYYYYLYITIYKFNIYIKFYIQFLYNIFKHNVTVNKLSSNSFKFFLYTYNFFKNILLWLNRRFLKKNKRFRIYYKYHNVRYWKFLLFFFYLYVFFSIWKRRNLYTKLQIIGIFIFLHILIMISLHFFIGFFNNFDLGFISCILFYYIVLLIFKK